MRHRLRYLVSGKVSLNDTVLVNYSYLADGTKVSALDAEGDGLCTSPFDLNIFRNAICKNARNLAICKPIG